MEHHRYVVMGAGEVGFHLARTLAHEGHSVTVIELAPGAQQRIEEELDVRLVPGNGAHARVLGEAEVADCDLFLAVSSADEANLAAALIAKQLGAKRTVARVHEAKPIMEFRLLYEELFSIDLLLSTQLLTTTRILNQIRGHNTVAVEDFANGKVQLRKLHLEAGSPLTQKPLKDLELPEDSLVVALFRDDELIIPDGNDQPQPGDEALILGRTGVISKFERMVTRKPETLGKVIIAGAGRTGRTVARALAKLDVEVTLIDRDRDRAEKAAALFPGFEVLHGDTTDASFFKSERLGRARTFVALTGNDETNLLGCLLAQDLGIDNVITMVRRIETSLLWRRLGLRQVFSPRALANQRIHEYIESGYSANIVSLQRGAAQVVQRRIYPASPTAGVTLSEINPPRGLIVGTVVRDDKVFVPQGADRLEVGDLVILFLREEELETAWLLFPGKDVPDA